MRGWAASVRGELCRLLVARQKSTLMLGSHTRSSVNIEKASVRQAEASARWSTLGDRHSSKNRDAVVRVRLRLESLPQEEYTSHLLRMTGSST